MNILQTIVAERQGDVEASKNRIPQRELAAMAADREHHGLSGVLISRRCGRRSFDRGSAG